MHRIRPRLERRHPVTGPPSPRLQRDKRLLAKFDPPKPLPKSRFWAFCNRTVASWIPRCPTYFPPFQARLRHVTRGSTCSGPSRSRWWLATTLRFWIHSPGRSAPVRLDRRGPLLCPQRLPHRRPDSRTDAAAGRLPVRPVLCPACSSHSAGVPPRTRRVLPLHRPGGRKPVISPAWKFLLSVQNIHLQVGTAFSTPGHWQWRTSSTCCCPPPGVPGTTSPVGPCADLGNLRRTVPAGRARPRLPRSRGSAPRPAYFYWIYYPTWSRLDPLVLGVALATSSTTSCLPGGDSREAAPWLWIPALGAIAAGLWLDEGNLTPIVCALSFPLIAVGMATLHVRRKPAAPVLPHPCPRIGVPGPHCHHVYLTHKLVVHAAAGCQKSHGIAPQLRRRDPHGVRADPSGRHRPLPRRRTPLSPAQEQNRVVIPGAPARRGDGGKAEGGPPALRLRPCNSQQRNATISEIIGPTAPGSRRMPGRRDCRIGDVRTSKRRLKRGRAAGPTFGGRNCGESDAP